jgi:hypothetical protein
MDVHGKKLARTLLTLGVARQVSHSEAREGFTERFVETSQRSPAK